MKTLSTQSLLQPWEGLAVIRPILQMGELRLSAMRRHSRGGSPSLCNFKVCALSTVLRTRETWGEGKVNEPQGRSRGLIPGGRGRGRGLIPGEGLGACRAQESGSPDHPAGQGH